jgi:hypothetical protein
VELYEQIRREYEHGAGTIRGVAQKLGVHRREVRLGAQPFEIRIVEQSDVTGQLDSPETAHSFAPGRIIVKERDYLVRNSRCDKRLDDAHKLRCPARGP